MIEALIYRMRHILYASLPKQAVNEKVEIVNIRDEMFDIY